MKFIVYDIRPGHKPGIYLPFKMRTCYDFAHRHYRYSVSFQHELRLLVGVIDNRSYRAVSFLDTAEGIERVYKLIQRYLDTGSNFEANSLTEPKDPDNVPCYVIAELKDKQSEDPGQRFLVGVIGDGLFVSESDLTAVAFDSADVSDGIVVLMKQFGHTPAEIHNAYQQIHFKGIPNVDENVFIPLVGVAK